MNKNAQVADLEEQMLMHVAAGLASNSELLKKHPASHCDRFETVVAKKAIEITNELFRLKNKNDEL